MPSNRETMAALEQRLAALEQRVTALEVALGGRFQPVPAPRPLEAP